MGDWDVGSNSMENSSFFPTPPSFADFDDDGELPLAIVA